MVQFVEEMLQRMVQVCSSREGEELIIGGFVRPPSVSASALIHHIGRLRLLIVIQVNLCAVEIDGLRNIRALEAQRCGSRQMVFSRSNCVSAER